METALPKNEEPEQVLEKPKKEKKPPSEAQQAARDKGLQAMMAKRKELAAKQKEKKEEVKKAKKIVEEKILKEDLRFASLNDLDSLKKEIFELRGMLSAKPQVIEKIVEKPIPAKPERIVERVIERVPTPSQPVKLSGSALLDKLFFDK